jgi:hypothetical protein
VILDANETETGNYEIHVISSFYPIITSVDFAVVASGVINQSSLELLFRPATACISCGSGTCNKATFICNCESSTLFGQSCQIAEHAIQATESPADQFVTVPPLESLYLNFNRPANPNSALTVHISSDSPVVLRIFLAEDLSPNGIPFRYDTVIWDNNTVRNNFEETYPGSVLHALVRNEFAVPWTFRVWAKTDIPPQTATSSSARAASSTTVIAIAVPVSVLVIVIVVAIVWVWRRRRTSRYQEESEYGAV